MKNQYKASTLQSNLRFAQYVNGGNEEWELTLHVETLDGDAPVKEITIAKDSCGAALVAVGWRKGNIGDTRYIWEMVPTESIVTNPSMTCLIVEVRSYGRGAARLVFDLKDLRKARLPYIKFI